MPRLNVQQILDATPDIKQEEVELAALSGTIVVRALATIQEYAAMQNQIQKAKIGMERGLPGYADLTDEIITIVAAIQAGYVPEEGEPPLDFMTAYKLTSKIGAQASYIRNRIYTMTGMFGNLLKEMEDALTADTFPNGTGDDLSGIPASTAE